MSEKNVKFNTVEKSLCDFVKNTPLSIKYEKNKCGHFNRGTLERVEWHNCNLYKTGCNVLPVYYDSLHESSLNSIYEFKHKNRLYVQSLK